MLIEASMPGASGVIVKDCNGNKVPYCLSFDTDTCEAEIVIQVGCEDGKPRFLMSKLPDTESILQRKELVKARVTLKGAWAERKDTGKKVINSDDLL